MAHTPGPWEIGTIEGHCVGIGALGMNGEQFDAIWKRFPDGTLVLVCSFEHSVMREGQNANARLIAAAPELVEALERLEAGVRLWISRGVSEEDMALARAALAKAKG